MFFEQNYFGSMPTVRTVTCRRSQVPRGSSNTGEKMVANESEVGVALVVGHCTRILIGASLEGEDSVRDRGWWLTHLKVILSMYFNNYNITNC